MDRGKRKEKENKLVSCVTFSKTDFNLHGSSFELHAVYICLCFVILPFRWCTESSAPPGWLSSLLVIVFQVVASTHIATSAVYPCVNRIEKCQ